MQRRNALPVNGKRGMLKHLFVAAFFGATLATVYGCSGFSTQEATDCCQAEAQGRSSCFDDKSYADCLSCFEDCGDDCVALAGCPTRYACPGDSTSGQQPE